jgi:hypothetical protein
VSLEFLSFVEQAEDQRRLNDMSSILDPLEHSIAVFQLMWYIRTRDHKDSIASFVILEYCQLRYRAPWSLPSRFGSEVKCKPEV